MKILIVNCGSSTLKFQLMELEKEMESYIIKRRLARGIADKIGSRGIFHVKLENNNPIQDMVEFPDHGAAIHHVILWLKSSDLLEPDGIEGVGHRVVHGGNRFISPVLIDDRVLSAMERVSELAPLHNEPALRAVRRAGKDLGAAVPMVAVFDTAFHSSMPKRASEYPIPQQLASTYGIRRFGFHGIAHRYMAENYARITSKPLKRLRLVTLQLGNGCSACALANGHSQDTSMGLTPLEGLMMGTRSGDVDPSLAGFTARRQGVSVEEVENWLNKRSGLLGVSGRSRDMRELLQLESQGDARAALAIEMFCYRVRKYMGAYMAALGGADAVLFGGGIGENAPSIRARICSDMEWSGLVLDPERNSKAIGVESRISSDDAGIDTYVILVDEAVIIAQDMVSFLDSQK